MSLPACFAAPTALPAAPFTAPAALLAAPFNLSANGASCRYSSYFSSMVSDSAFVSAPASNSFFSAGSIGFAC